MMARRLFMAWKGAGGDSAIYFSSTVDGFNWAPQRRIEGVGTSHSPALTSESVRVRIAWKGAGGDSAIYYSSSPDGVGWAPQQRYEGVGTSHGPALAALRGDGVLQQSVWMVWKGSPGDTGLYWSHNPLIPDRFDPQSSVRFCGTSEKPTLAFNRSTSTLFMAWKGIDGDSGIWTKVKIGNNDWLAQRNVPNVGTSAGPALALGFQNAWHMVWKGAGGDTGIYFSKTDDLVNWAPQRRIEGVGTSTSPALAEYNGLLHLAWRGIGNDSRIYFSSSENGVNWTPQRGWNDVGTSDGPSLAAL
jgi:hypothetical protein